jgi:hypothetical protein
MSARTLQQRVMMLALVSIAVVAAGVGYAALTRPTPPESPAAALAPPALRLPADPHLAFRSTALGPGYGRVGLMALAEADGPFNQAEMACDRVHVAAGRGICLSADRGVFTTYHALLFDDGFTVRHELPLAGLPSRARVAPDGRRGAFTIFISGDSYDSAGFSTRTFIVDMASGATLGQLEEFAVSRNNAPFKAIDFNFWGVTFARDGNRFYATLGTGGQTYLVEGDVDARTARVVTTGVECPSLSPDNRRIGFKRRVDGPRGAARIHVLDLDTLALTPLAETRNVDDQVEWLDDDRILYALPDGDGSSTIWAAAADGTGEPVPFKRNAYSPAVIR